MNEKLTFAEKDFTEVMLFHPELVALGDVFDSVAYQPVTPALSKALRESVTVEDVELFTPELIEIEIA